jgi:hypothetical protein
MEQEDLAGMEQAAAIADGQQQPQQDSQVQQDDEPPEAP